jgi:hypothetical protein
MSKPRVLWEDRDCLALWSNGVISVSDGVGYVGIVDAKETRELYEALGKYYGDDKLKSELTAALKENEEAKIKIKELEFDIEGLHEDLAGEDL